VSCVNLVGGRRKHNNIKPLDPAAIARFGVSVGNEYSFHTIDPPMAVPIIAALSLHQVLVPLVPRPELVLPILRKRLAKEKQNPWFVSETWYF
jgi:hypothetical protein